MRGSLFPLFPLFSGPIFSSCQDMDHQNRGNRGNIGTLSWFWHFTLRGNRGNRDPLSVFPWWNAKTMKGSLFHLFWWPMSIHPVKTWTTKIGEIGEIGTLSWFWHFTLRGNRGNKGPLMLLALHQGKTLRGSLFPLFWWPMSWQDDKAWTTKIGEIGENRDPLMVLALHP